MKRIGLLLAVCLAATLVVAGPPVYAADRQTQIEREKRDLRQKIKSADAKAKSLTQQIAESDSRKAVLEKELASLTAQLREAERRLAAAESELAVARAELVSVEGHLTQALAQADDLRSTMDLRTRKLYTHGGIGFYVNLLLGASDLRTFFSRMDFVKKVVEDDKQQIVATQALAAELEQSRTQATLRRDDIAAKKAAIEAERSNIASLQSRVKANRSKVNSEIAHRQSLLAGVKADKAGYLKEMARLEAESRSIAALLRSRQKGQVWQAGSGKRLAWPTTGSVSSPYGYRTHPVFGDRRMHTGIDIKAPAGQTVIAAEAGTVVFAGAKGGYGLTVVIDHGDALATLYAHLSALGVGTGSRVSRGTRVGAVGCSGYCTGPHLHFETRINGEHRNPMEFF